MQHKTSVDSSIAPVENRYHHGSSLRMRKSSQSWPMPMAGRCPTPRFSWLESQKPKYPHFYQNFLSFHKWEVEPLNFESQMVWVFCGYPQMLYNTKGDKDEVTFRRFGPLSYTYVMSLTAVMRMRWADSPLIVLTGSARIGQKWVNHLQKSRVLVTFDELLKRVQPPTKRSSLRRCSGLCWADGQPIVVLQTHRFASFCPPIDEEARKISIVQATFHTSGSWGWVGKGKVRGMQGDDISKVLSKAKIVGDSNPLCQCQQSRKTTGW